MTILRSLQVSKSPNSSVLGLLTHRDQQQEYVNPEYKTKLHGEPLDAELYFNDPVLKPTVCNQEPIESLNGVFHLTAKDVVDGTVHHAVVNVINGVVVVVCCGESLLWVHPEKCSRDIIHSTLRQAMKPMSYEAYLDNEQRSFQSLRGH